MKKNENLKRMTKSQRNEMAVEAATKTKDQNNNVIRIVFKNKEKSQKKQQFIMDINSELTLEEFEQKLLKCKDESDIEDLQEDC